MAVFGDSKGSTGFCAVTGRGVVDNGEENILRRRHCRLAAG